jgi:nitrogen fixation NifU-like protein
MDAMIEELYQEIILDHYRSPRHRGRCPHCGRTAHRDNPLCGDEITLGLELSEGTIARVVFEGQGCSISQASASMMAEAVDGLGVERALELAASVRRLMHGEPPEEDLGDLMALSGVARFPVRVKCALLPWTALVEALS